ncbi:MAG TPA: formate/nitrite transporter family protein [Anaerolineales bacterium]
MSDEKSSPERTKKSYEEILEQEIEEGLKELNRPASGLLISGLSAGLDIGFGALFMAIMLTLAEGRLAPPVEEILVASMYSLGFIFVIVGRSELFTEHTTLAVLPVMDRKSSLLSLGRLWALVYVSNLVGAALFASLAAFIGPQLGIVAVSNFGEIAAPLVHHTWWVIVTSGVLAGWLMGLLSWLLVAARETISQIVVVWLVTAAIGLGHFHHSIAGSVEVLTAVFALQEYTLAQFFHFLAWTTLGNVIGGVFFVALVKYSHATRSNAG